MTEPLVMPAMSYNQSVLTLVLERFRAGSGGALPGAPPAPSAVDAIMSNWHPAARAAPGLEPDRPIAAPD